MFKRMRDHVTLSTTELHGENFLCIVWRIESPSSHRKYDLIFTHVDGAVQNFFRVKYTHTGYRLEYFVGNRWAAWSDIVKPAYQELSSASFAKKLKEYIAMDTYPSPTFPGSISK